MWGKKKIHVVSFQLDFSGNLTDYSACVNSRSLGPEAEVNYPITGDAAVNVEIRQRKHQAQTPFPPAFLGVGLRM